MCPRRICPAKSRCASAITWTAAEFARSAKYVSNGTRVSPTRRRMNPSVAIWSSAVALMTSGQLSISGTLQVESAAVVGGAIRINWPLALLTRQQSRSISDNVRSITPRCDPSAPGCTTGVPWIVPASGSSQSGAALCGAGKSSCVCPAITASTPSSWARGTTAFSMCGCSSVGPNPLWLKRMTRSAPASRTARISRRAAVRMSSASSLPSNRYLSHIRVCGGANPMTPMRNRRDLPDISCMSRSRMTQGGTKLSPSTRLILAKTAGKDAPARAACRNSNP